MAVSRKVTVGVFAETAEAQRKLDAIAAEAEALGKLNPEIKPQIDRRAASQSLAVLTAELRKAGKEAEGLSGSAGSVAASAESAGAGLTSMASPMGALIGAGVALSPVIFTLGAGLGGLAIGAAGTLSPLLKAAQAAGGLKANLHKLNPEQQAAGRSLLGLGKDYAAFEKALAPAVLSDFSGAVRIAGHVLHDLEPVSKATGIALGGLLSAVDKELASGTWQQFFGFMAREAGPDISLVTANLTDLMQLLPPLVQSLQPVAAGFLTLSDDILKSASAAHKWNAEADRGINRVPVLGQVYRGVIFNFDHLWKTLGFKTTPALKRAATASTALGVSIGTVTSALSAQLTPLLTSQQDWVTWKQSQQAAKTAIDHVKGSLNGQSTAALAADQQIITSTQSAIAFAGSQDKTKAGVARASRVIQDQITFLETHASKSRIAKKEIDLLREAERKLRDIHQQLTVTGAGRWDVVGPGGPGHHVGKMPAAAGWRVPGFGGGDRWPALLEGGEAVIPKHLVPPLAPFLKANKVPGFSAGGIVASYQGAVPGLGKWLVSEDNATLLALQSAVAKATFAGMRAAMSGFGAGQGRAGLRPLENLWTGAGGPGGGTAHVAAAIALAESGGRANAVGPRTPSGSAMGLWQILGQVVAGNIFDPHINALNAVSKYFSAGGFSPWVTFETGAYKQFMDSGGWLRPGWNPPMYNATGRPEHLVPVRSSRPGEDLGPKLDKIIKQNARMIALLETAPAATGAATARGTSRALNGMRIPAARPRGG
jgi:hypothetical protein